MALVLGVVLVLGYFVLAPGASNAPESSKLTPVPTPKVTASATQTPKITPTISPTPIPAPAADQRIKSWRLCMGMMQTPAGTAGRRYVWVSSPPSVPTALAFAF
ncbi:MAG: hypothetical protein KJ714_04310 [Euryarchaeota archaeon]|nr:hypothetical protein [Euryarchaeota archaeon]